MNHKPILFSTPMVQAILAGNKTQTRRVIYPQPDAVDHDDFGGVAIYHGKGQGGMDLGKRSRYGVPGNLLWVRETYSRKPPVHSLRYKANLNDFGIKQHAAQYGGWKPSIHMPKSAARIWLRITDVKVERLRSISEEDAKAEGAPHQEWKSVCTEDQGKSYKYGFINIWNAIHKDSWGPTGWNSDPWVWAVTFEVLTTNGILTGDVGPELHGINAPRPTPPHNS